MPDLLQYHAQYRQTGIFHQYSDYLGGLAKTIPTRPYEPSLDRCLYATTPNTAKQASFTNISNIYRYFHISADAWQLRCISMT